MERLLGVAVHAALARWQRGVDGGGPRRAETLLDLARREAATRRLEGEDLDRALHRLEPGLRNYAEGPWPRRATLYLEHSARHLLAAPDGFAVELHLRLDRVVRHRRTVAILDFKTVTPHLLEMRADEWQLRTYAIAAPDLLGLAPAGVELVIIDLERGVDHQVLSDEPSLAATTAQLLAAARGIDGAMFDVASGHADRPCWSCGYRLTCPASLAPASPAG